MADCYTSGQYLDANPSWHIEDSVSKAAHVLRMMDKHRLTPTSIAEIGCGVGGILAEVAKRTPETVRLSGYDISPQAIEIARTRESTRVRFYMEDLFAAGNSDHFDLLLVIDVFEHVPDYLGFLSRCQTKAEYKIYHVPLDISASTVLTNRFMNGRASVGHLHYFTAESALATLRDTDHEIVDHVYVSGTEERLRDHPSLKGAIAHGVRRLCSSWSLPATARVLGGYSLWVLAR